MPLVDAATLDGARLHTDVCIIGGGPAGIVVATELVEEGHEVVVLEAGFQTHDLHRVRDLPRTAAGHAYGSQADTRGRNRGMPYFPLRMSRVRGIGGSTRALKNHGLRSRPLDPIDFEPIVGEGWPLPYGEFASYLAEASSYCGIPGNDLSWEAWNPQFSEDHRAELAMVGFRHGPRETFQLSGIRACESERQRWITSAAATGFEVDATGHITGVRVAARSRTSFTVEARYVVLASGGIDNARLLLANEPLLEHMGPAADHVGRYFMEHLHYVAGHLIPNSPEAGAQIARCFQAQDGQDPWLIASDSVVRAEGLARTAFAAVPSYASSLNPGVSALGRILRSVPYGPFDRSLWSDEVRTALRGATKIPAGAAEQLNPSVSRNVFAVTSMSEQTPNPASRITLSDRKDRTGLRLPVLDWKLSELDISSARRSAELLGDELAAAGLGEFVPAWNVRDGRFPAVTGGWHHMGTTRMSTRASQGVVDANCGVHGVPNLFVAGSSVFRTGGFANPTLSLVALSIRLARHIAQDSTTDRQTPRIRRHAH
jgi:choline dehydrogenase-like flavoprotein